MNRYILWGAMLGAALTTTMAADVAEACGGFFCSGAGPNQVNQAAERIVFAQHPDNTVTAVVQIIYQGPADRFGWLLPVPGIPDVELSSDVAFTRLQNATNPQYQLNQTVEGTCREDDRFNNATASGARNNGSFEDGANNGANNGVSVLARGNTGPYDYVVIQVDSENDKTQIALDWLEDNNYEVTNAGPDLIGPYLDEGYNLLAIRLQKTSDAGSVRPIRLTYDSDHPMIPIKLTAVAANADMGVMTWVLGDERAVPINYKALELNDSLLNWFNPTSNYNDVVIAAANEASGQGFVTEYADETSTLGKVVWTVNDENLWADLQSQDWTGRWQTLLDRSIYGFGVNDPSTFAWQPLDGLDQVIDATMPDITAEDRQYLTECPSCFVNDGKVPADFDYTEWISAMAEHMIEPMVDTQKLFDDTAYVTRLYTTMSADEMTVDPSFDFNPDLGAQSNIHTANQIIECTPDVYRWEAPYRIELPSGLVVRGEQDGQWPVQPGDMMPATLTVAEVGTSGKGMVVRDNYATVQQQLEVLNAKVPTPLGGRDVSGGGGKGNPSSCSSVDARPDASALLLLLALAGTRLRRRD